MRVVKREALNRSSLGNDHPAMMNWLPEYRLIRANEKGYNINDTLIAN